MGKNDYTIPKGRLAVVSSVQNYSKHYTPQVSHFIKKGGRNPRHQKKNEYHIYETEYPLVHHKVPKLLDGKVKLNFKQNDIFDIDKKPPKKIPKPIFYYRNEFTGQWN
tara:strand:+ start:390 stop:713 length:324 start_codon:yes stop_codon:yes gene_type:complete